MEEKTFGALMKDIKGYLTLNQVRDLLALKGIPFRMQLILRMLWVTGCRISELEGDKSWYKKDHVFEGVRVKDTHFNEGYIDMDTLKRKVYPPPKRTVALDNITLGMLKIWISYESLKPEDKLFTISKRHVEQLVQIYGEKAGIKKVGDKKLHPHTMRHSHCVAYIRKNNSMEGLRKLQQNLGHANINTTAYYL